MRDSPLHHPSLPPPSPPGRRRHPPPAFRQRIVGIAAQPQSPARSSALCGMVQVWGEKKREVCSLLCRVYGVWRNPTASPEGCGGEAEVCICVLQEFLLLTQPNCIFLQNLAAEWTKAWDTGQ